MGPRTGPGRRTQGPRGPAATFSSTGDPSRFTLLRAVRKLSAEQGSVEQMSKWCLSVTSEELALPGVEARKSS